MKKIIIIILLFTCRVYPQMMWEKIPTSVSSKIICLAHASDNSLLIGTDEGKIFYSPPFKFNWTYLGTLTNLKQLSVFSLTDFFALADGCLYENNSLFDHWRKIETVPTLRQLTSLSIINERILFVTDNFAVYKSVDLGNTWEMTSLRYNYFSNIVSSVEDEIIVSSETATLLSTNQGETWRIIGKDFSPLIYIGYISSIKQLSSRTILVGTESGESTTGNYGGLFLTTNQGTDWENVITGSSVVDFMPITKDSVFVLLNYLDQNRLLFLNKINDNWEITNFDDLSYKRLGCFSKDRLGNIYVGGANGSLYLLKKNFYNKFNIQQEDSLSEIDTNGFFALGGSDSVLNESSLMKNYDKSYIVQKEIKSHALSAYQPYDHSQTIDINNITMTIKNDGTLSSDFGYPFGAEWNKITGSFKSIVFDHGPIVIGKIDNKPQIAYTFWSSYYAPGPIIDGKAALQLNTPDYERYRVYKINEKDNMTTNQDYAEWPSDLGAETYNGKPVIFDDQTLFTVYNAYDDSSSRRRNQYYNDQYPPIPVEINQNVYAYDNSSPDVFKDIIFFEWEIINKGEKTIDSTYCGLWTDIDFFDIYSNIPAVDSLLRLCYCWSGTDYYGGEFGPAPAVGYMMVYGPVVESPGDTAIYKGRRNANHKNLGITSFHGITSEWDWNISGFFNNTEEAWKYAQGLDPDGNPIINYYTGKSTKLMFSGNPITNEGWIYPENKDDSEAGFYMFSGPFNLAPNDTQWVMFALIPGLGADRYDSIKKMKRAATILQQLNYDQIVTKTIVEKEEPSLPEYFHLSQNFPNPFNPTTKIRYELPIQTHVNLSVYDILGRKVAELVNKEQNTGYYEVEIDGSNWASGIYFIRIESYIFSKSVKAILLK